ncbi:sugar ABC transporter substrate-binding protein [Ectobacillus funiculus]|uniref:sugar ABC transporter substrate-binding protein n=1 Tax=Ectobacillus funiculus TaxID=137993 RepID=UPI00397D794A
MKTKWIILLISLAFVATVLGCIVKFLRTDDRPKVVIVLKDLDTQYWKIIKAGAEKGFRDFDIDGKVVAPPYGSEEDVQGYMLEKVLKEHPDVLVISPFESAVVMSKLKQAVENKIPVLLVSTDAPLEHKTAYIGTDNFELGRKAGELLASGLKPGDEVALITARNFGGEVLDARIKGAMFSLEGAGIKIVTEKAGLPNKPELVRKAMTMILQEHPDVKGVFATTDIMALSALEVVKEHAYKMPVIGADGIIQMVESIEDGTLTGTVAQNPYDMGYISAETALKIIKGEGVRKTIDTGVDIITKDNANQKLDLLQEWLR